MEEAGGDKGEGAAPLAHAGDHESAHILSVAANGMPCACIACKDPPTRTDLSAVVAKFCRLQAEQPHMSLVVPAIRALTELIRTSTASTMMGIEVELKNAVNELLRPSSCGQHFISLGAAMALFMRFINRHTHHAQRRSSMHISDFEACRAALIDRGELFAQNCLSSRDTISRLARPFLHDGMVIMTRGFSRVVLQLLKDASHSAHFSVVVTESRPDQMGYIMAKALQDIGIPVTLVLDAATAYIMERVDAVFTGAEGVVENGGIISGIGTYEAAMVAHMLGKPFYTAVESFKFARMFPLGQTDLPERCLEETPWTPVGGVDALKAPPDYNRYMGPNWLSSGQGPTAHASGSAGAQGRSGPGNSASALSNSAAGGNAAGAGMTVLNPRWDHTPPAFITLLFTDLGALTPSAVSDELIQLYTGD